MSYKQAVLLICIVTFVGLTHTALTHHEDVDIRSSLLNSLNHKTAEEIFPVFHSFFKKNYGLNSSEGDKRLSIFKANVEFIKDFNSRNNYKLGINQFTDLTDEEFRSRYISNTIPPVKQVESQLTFLGEEEKLESSYYEQVYQQIGNPDWTSNIKNPAKDQGDCGSCWAQATNQAIEINYHIKFGQSPEFSAQQLVDCDTLHSSGCEGGSPILALDYIIKTGIAYENAYPYISGDFNKSTPCQQSKVVLNKVVSGYELCDIGACTIAKWKYHLSRGPIIVQIDGDGNTAGASILSKYHEGIIDNMKCEEANHVVVVVGMGTDALGNYYIARNSWGSSWGENGNFRFRVRPSDHTCFMEEFAVLPIVTKTKNPVPPPPVKGCLKAYSECYYKGSSVEVCENTTNIPISVKGINIGKFKEALIFTGENCTGGQITLERNFGCLTNVGQVPELAGRAKSIVVSEVNPSSGCISFYSKSCLAGTKVDICNNVTNMNSLKLANKSMSFNSSVASFKVFTQPKCTGGFFEIDFDKSYNIQEISASLVGRIESLVLKDITPPSGCAWLYSDYCLSGQRVEICADTPDMFVKGFYKKTSSLKLGPGVKGFVIYGNVNYKGSYANLTTDSHYSLYTQATDKWIASVKLLK